MPRKKDQPAALPQVMASRPAPSPAPDPLEGATPLSRESLSPTFPSAYPRPPGRVEVRVTAAETPAVEVTPILGEMRPTPGVMPGPGGTRYGSGISGAAVSLKPLSSTNAAGLTPSPAEVMPPISPPRTPPRVPEVHPPETPGTVTGSTGGVSGTPAGASEPFSLLSEINCNEIKRFVERKQTAAATQEWDLARVNADSRLTALEVSYKKDPAADKREKIEITATKITHDTEDADEAAELISNLTGVAAVKLDYPGADIEQQKELARAYIEKDIVVVISQELFDNLDPALQQQQLRNTRENANRIPADIKAQLPSASSTPSRGLGGSAGT